jgi:putative ABC transport system permease protein
VSGGFDASIKALSDARLRVQNRVSWTRWLPLAERDEIKHVPGVIGVAAYAYFGGYYQDPKNGLGAGAVDAAEMFKVFPELDLPPAQRQAMLHTRTGALVGAELAQKFGWKLGDHIPLGTPIWGRKDGGSWAVDIVGIYRFKNDALPANEMWMNYDYFDQGRIGLNGMASLFIVAIDDPAHAARISRAIDARLRNSSAPTLTQSEKEWVGARIRRVGNVRFLVDAILGAVLFTLLALTANTMMQSVRERIAEFAVLKTFGYANPIVAALVLVEALLLCLSAAVCGLGVAAFVFPRVFQLVGIGTIPLPLSVLAAGLVVAILLAVVSSAPPLWRALRLDVAAAFRAH